MMTLKGGTSQACAVCKFQRRRCTKECHLARYFPADDPEAFQYAHRLFGVSNITRILKKVSPDQRDEAMKSIKYQSQVRSKYPVHGCLQVIFELRVQIRYVEEELRRVLAQLDAIKHRFGGQSSERSDLAAVVVDNPDSSFLDANECFVKGDYNDNLGYGEGDAQAQTPTQQFPYLNNFCLQNGETDVLKGVESNADLTQALFAQQEIDVLQDCEEMQYDAIAVDEQSYMKVKEACELRDWFSRERAQACSNLDS